MDAVHVGGLGGTYGGNPVACSAALAAIEKFENGGLIERAHQIEGLAMGLLRSAGMSQPRIGEVGG